MSRFIVAGTIVALTWVSQDAFAQTVSFGNASGMIPFSHKSVSFGGDGLGGAAWLDYDLDGFDDLYLTNGKTQANALFKNNGDGTFTEIAAAAGVANGSGNCAALAGDIDNDGYPDLFLTGDGGVTGNGESPLKLYHNNQDGTFSDITAGSGIQDMQSAMSACFGDVDNDGFLDLFITGPGSFISQTQTPSRLYRNNGDLTFTDMSGSAGVNTSFGACASLFSDYDDDGFVDLFVANCNSVVLTPTPIELFRNNHDFTFTDNRASAGLTQNSFWMGLGLLDHGNDGDVDIAVTNITNLHAFYENQGNGTFIDKSSPLGLKNHDFAWGVSTADLNNDGASDVFHAGSFPFLGFIGPGSGSSGSLFQSDGLGGFTKTSSSLPPVNLSNRFSSGVASSDFDQDGFTDLVIVTDELNNNTGRPVLLRNQGNSNGWVQITLQGTTGNRDAAGARVEVTTGGTTQTRELLLGSSFASTDSKRLTFGLGTASITDRIRVLWPLGRVEEFLNQASGTHSLLVEGQGVSSFVAYGQGCKGGGGFTPKLDLTGSVQAGGSFELTLEKTTGLASSAIFLLGLQSAEIPMSGGCSLLVGSLLPVAITMPLTGAGLGGGSGTISGIVPAGASSGTVYIQAFVADVLSPAGFANSGGLKLTVE